MIRYAAIADIMIKCTIMPAFRSLAKLHDVTTKRRHRQGEHESPAQQHGPARRRSGWCRTGDQNFLSLVQTNSPHWSRFSHSQARAS